MYAERHHCRACGSDQLHHAVDLGKTALANDFIEPGGRSQGEFPLRIDTCTNCGFIQIREIIDPQVLYSHYAYVMSTSKTIAAHIEQITGDLLNAPNSVDQPRVLEIASNTGLVLKAFQQRGCEVIGVEPAENIAALAEQDGIPTLNVFFDKHSGARIAAEHGRYDLVMGRHVFAHIDDLHGLLEGLDQIASEQAVIAFEVPYGVDFYDNTEFDTVYHEHLSYVTVSGLLALVENSPFMLQRVDHYDVHGGSIIFQLRRASLGLKADASVAHCLEMENQRGLKTVAAWDAFAARVSHLQTDLKALLGGLKAEGKTIIGYGASAKGNTLLNTTGITTDTLDFIIDNTPFKIGMLAPGSNIPVRSPDALLDEQPDYALILAWTYAKEIAARETEYQQRGGRFIVPLPSPRILEFDATTER